MKFSVNWLQDYVEPSLELDALLESLTMAGTEVETVERLGEIDEKVVVAQIESFGPHPDADRLSVCLVNDGQGQRQIVCGAKNFSAGDKVPLALPGATVISGKDGGEFKIKSGKLRGEKSEGMLCSPVELAISDDAQGLLILDPDTPVGVPLREVVTGDTVFEVEITPNRPDLLSYLGLAREIAACGAGTVKPFAWPQIDFPANESGWQVELPAPAAGPYYAATVLKNVQVGPSPEWLADRIRAMGHQPINNVVDITNYVLYEIGQPLHAFDLAKLSGHTISVRYAEAGEEFRALDEATYRLEADDLVIADEAGPVALAGVMGGLNSGVTETTTGLLLEAAWFDPAHVRRTSRRLGLISDSSYRYERRVDPAAVLRARDRAIALFCDLAGAEVAAAPVVAGEPPVLEREVTLRLPRLGKLIGLGLPAERINDWMEKLGLELVGRPDTEVTYRIPSFRPDLEREVDLIEEIARLHGMVGVPARINLGVTPSSAADLVHDRLAELRRLLAGWGWNECNTDTLVEAGWVEPDRALAVGNPLNEQYTHLRTGLRASLVAVAGRNLARGVSGVRLFEAGKVFERNGGATAEPTRLGLLVAGEGAEEHWHTSPRSADLADLQGALDALLYRHGFEEGDVLEATRVAPSFAKGLGLKAPAFYAELRLDAWLARDRPPARYEPLPAFPSLRRDIAVVVPRSLPQAEVVAAVNALNLKALESIRLFDIFTDDTGEKIPADRKSLAYALTYRAADRTLTEKEVGKWQDKIRRTLEEKLGAVFRDA
ncbi:MAG: phenylalanine--tRNA ligase subunit beta [Verrucomicrobiota bacterium]